MPDKTPAQRLNDTVTALDVVAADIGHYLRFCLQNAPNPPHATWGANVVTHAAYNLAPQATALGTGVSLGNYVGSGQAVKQQRRLRRGVMLLESALNGTAFATSKGTTSGRTDPQLQADIRAIWKTRKLAEIRGIMNLRIGAKGAGQVMTKFGQLAQLEQGALLDALTDGLFAGDTSEEKFKADVRGGVLLLHRLNQPAVPPGGTTAFLNAQKPGLLALTADQLTTRLRDEWRAFQDAQQENIDLQAVLNNFTAAPLTFLRTVSVHACDGDVPTGANWTVADMDALGAPTIVRLGFVNREGSEKGALDLVPIDSTTRGVEMHFLPWKSQRMTKLRIPANTGPGLFFTAAINGCSVFVTGTAQSPTIYHGGIESPLQASYTDTANPTLAAAATAGNSARFWRELLKLREVLTDADILGEVNRNHYVKDLVTNSMSRICDWETTTAGARAFEQTLQGQAAIRPLQVFPWGCVFGIRSPAGDWSFYLQENATVFYEDPATTDLWVTSRPFRIDRIFPGAAVIAPTSNFVNVPSNFAVTWDGTNQVIAAPFTESRYVIKNPPYTRPVRPPVVAAAH